jgi:molybdenum cofactor biosynthesis enzyme MoaA
MTLLTDDLAGRLGHLHGLEMRCSVDAATRDTYRKIRGLDLFDRVTAAMERLSAIARERPRVRVIPIYVVMRENLAEVVPFVHWAKRFRPERIEFHPVRHVQDWVVENHTGWTFNGAEQSCEFLKDEYNQVMREAADACRREGLSYEISYL